MEATSLEQVVAAINTNGDGAPYFGGLDYRSPEEMAAQWALSAVASSDYSDVTEENLEGHLEILEQAGARFDFSGAVAAALEMHNKAENLFNASDAPIYLIIDQNGINEDNARVRNVSGGCVHFDDNYGWEFFENKNAETFMPREGGYSIKLAG